MRTRAHMGVMLAAAAAMAGVEALGAQRMALPAINLPSLSLGGGNSKAGKHRRSGTAPGAGPKHHTSYWRKPTQAKESAKFLARGEAGDDHEWRKRMAWNEIVYPRVLEHQAKQRASSR